MSRVSEEQNSNQIPWPHEGELPPRSRKHKSSRSSVPPALYLLVIFILIIVLIIIGWWLLREDTEVPVTQPAKQDEMNSEELTAKPDLTSSEEREQADENEDVRTDEDTEQPIGNNESDPSVTEPPDDNEIQEESSDVSRGEHETDAVSSPSENPGDTRTIYHRVQKGETLFSITMKYYGSKIYMDKLAEYNHIQDPAQLKAGTVLEIPPLNKK
ncbi:MAG: LysM peptidoglycan-binding domain-containing protein [Bacillaceae bacterium]|nr:LysM peptidoglycan-binding domain-containing protein [Bacillaceae bacterium]